MNEEDHHRLATLDGESLACEAVEAVMAHLDRLALHLFPRHRAAELRAVSWAERGSGRWRETALSCELGVSVRDLTRFAQGEDLDVLCVPAWMGAVQGALLWRAVADESYVPGDEALAHACGEGDLAAAIGTVVLAARRRMRRLRPTRPEVET